MIMKASTDSVKHDKRNQFYIYTLKLMAREKRYDIYIYNIVYVKELFIHSFSYIVIIQFEKLI